jgi:hypothetical protein
VMAAQRPGAFPAADAKQAFQVHPATSPHVVVRARDEMALTQAGCHSAANAESGLSPLCLAGHALVHLHSKVLRSGASQTADPRQDDPTPPHADSMCVRSAEAAVPHVHCSLV